MQHFVKTTSLPTAADHYRCRHEAYREDESDHPLAWARIQGALAEKIPDEAKAAPQRAAR
eukprot:1215345-Pyramimonas_sp.AAC.1